MEHKGQYGPGMGPLPDAEAHDPIKPEDEFVILRFLLFVEQAYRTTTDKKKISDFQTNTAAAVTDFSKKVYGLDIPHESVAGYFSKVKAIAKNAWGPNAVAQIMSRRVKDSDTFGDINSFLKTNSDDKRLGPMTRWLMAEALIAMHDPSNNNAVLTRWTDFKREQGLLSGVAVPKLLQFYEINPTGPFDARAITMFDADRVLNDLSDQED